MGASAGTADVRRAADARRPGGARPARTPPRHRDASRTAAPATWVGRCRRWTCWWRSTSASCGSARTSRTGRSATGSSCPRATAPSRLYAVMAMRGYFPVEELLTFDTGRQPAPGPPGHAPAARVSTRPPGSLGQGLADRRSGSPWARAAAGLGAHTFVMLGDGEVQEGQVWETVHVAPRYGAGNLTAIVDRNGLQQYGWALRAGRGASRQPAGPLGRRRPAGRLRGASAGGCSRSTGTTSARSSRPARTSGRARAGDVPTAILARTIKGRGLSLHRGSLGVARAGGHGRRGGGRAPGAGADACCGGATRHDEAAARRLGRHADRARQREPRRPGVRRRPRHVDEGGQVRRRAPGPVLRDGDRGAGDGRHGGRHLACWATSRGSRRSASSSRNRALDQVRMAVAQTHANVKIGAAYTGLHGRALGQDAHRHLGHRDDAGDARDDHPVARATRRRRPP